MPEFIEGSDQPLNRPIDMPTPEWISETPKPPNNRQDGGDLEHGLIPSLKGPYHTFRLTEDMPAFVALRPGEYEIYAFNIPGYDKNILPPKKMANTAMTGFASLESQRIDDPCAIVELVQSNMGLRVGPPVANEDGIPLGDENYISYAVGYPQLVDLSGELRLDETDELILDVPDELNLDLIEQLSPIGVIVIKKVS